MPHLNARSQQHRNSQHVGGRGFDRRWRWPLLVALTLAGSSLTAVVAPGANAETVRASLTWNTDNTDIDLHVWDSSGAHAWYADTGGIPGASLSADNTQGFGPETFTELDPVGRGLVIGVCYYSGAQTTTASLSITDPDGSTRNFTTTLVSPGQGSIITSSPDGAVDFTPPADFCGYAAPEPTPTPTPEPTPTPTPTPTSADLVAGVAGFGARTRVGKVDTVRATVTNAGPSAASAVELRFGTPRGTEYGYVRAPGPGWSCSVTAVRFVLCTASSLAPGASATLTVGVFAEKERETRLAVRVASATPDPNLANNLTDDEQVIRAAQSPPPPNQQNAARANSPWRQVSSSPNLWIRATDVFYRLPDINRYELQGAVGATMWSWEGGDSKVVRFELTNTLTSDAVGIQWHNLRKTGKNEPPNGPGNSYTWFTKQWTISADDPQDGLYMKGTYKFIRSGLHRNKKYDFRL